MKERIAIVGAGVSGLVSGVILRQAGAEVVVAEKSQGIGGRLATRRIDSWRWNHGAPYASVASRAFRTFGASLASSGSALATDGKLIGVPDMQGLLQPLAAELDIRAGVRVDVIHSEERGFVIPEVDGYFDRVLIAAPAPQAKMILPQWREQAPDLAQVALRPIWTLLLGFETPIDAPNELNDDVIAEVRVQNIAGSKPAWVVHATEAWSRDNVALAKADVEQQLVAQLANRLGMDLAQRAAFATVHRWRYGITQRTLGRPYLLCPAGKIGLCGDWCLGQTADDAFRSGVALAQAVIERMGKPSGPRGDRARPRAHVA